MTIDWIERVETWIAEDPWPENHATLRKWLEKGEFAKLESAFGKLPHFGTAGLRAVVGPGPSLFNAVVVRRYTWALTQYIQERFPELIERGMVVGFDGRRRSKDLAEEVARVAASVFRAVRVFAAPVPTPVLAYSLLESHAAVGVMITASHNPPEYNGYKLYWHDGVQVRAPHDTAIEALAAQIQGKTEPQRNDGLAHIERLGNEMEHAYLRELETHRLYKKPAAITIAYTALHGVGERFMRSALNAAGYQNVESVREQSEPDADFPTVNFPNPEVAGALDRVLALAEQTHADIVLANDPDADRLAVAVKTKSQTFRVLSGNEIGILLGHFALEARKDVGVNRLVVTTVVSSPMLEAVAKAAGAQCALTLTGFKWIAGEALRATQEDDAVFVMGYEEALGYLVGDWVWDKDGVSAGVAVADMASWCKENGRSLLDELEVLYRKVGVYRSGQVTHRFSSSEVAGAVVASGMKALRDHVGKVCGEGVASKQDFASAEPSSGLRAELLQWRLASGARVTVRPSGTEPLIKVYLDVSERVREGEILEETIERADARITSLKDAASALLKTYFKV